MIELELEVSEIKRYIRLCNLIGQDEERNDYSKDMDDLINYLNDTFKSLNSYKIKKTLYFGHSLDEIVYKYTYSSGGTSTRKGYIITLDDNIFLHLRYRFCLSTKSINNILIYWITKYNKIEISRIKYVINFNRDCFIRLNR